MLMYYFLLFIGILSGITLLLVTRFLNEGNHFPGFWTLLLHWTVCTWLPWCGLTALALFFTLAMIFRGLANVHGLVHCLLQEALRKERQVLLSGSHSHRKSAMMDVACPGRACWVIPYGFVCYFYVCTCRVCLWLCQALSLLPAPQASSPT